MILRGKCVAAGIAEGRVHVVDVGGWLAAALLRDSLCSATEEIERLEAARARAGGSSSACGTSWPSAAAPRTPEFSRPKERSWAIPS